MDNDSLHHPVERLPPGSDPVDHIAAIRDRLVNAVLVVLSLLGVPALAASLYRAGDIGWRPVMGLHVGLLVLFVATTIARRRLPFAMRAGIVAFAVVTMAAGGIATSALPVSVCRS